MPGILKNIKDFLTYKPEKTEEFELLEEEFEGNKNRNINEGKIIDKEYKFTNNNQYNFDKKNGSGEIQAANKLAFDLNINLLRIKLEFNVPKNRDIVIREFNVSRKVKAFLVFVDGMADKKVLNEGILRELMNPKNFAEYDEGTPIDYIADSVLSINQITKSSDYKEIVLEVLNGLTALFIDGSNECILIETRGYEKRNVDKPQTETVIAGSQEGFTENLRTNLTLVRRIIRNKDLITEIYPVGKKNNSNCAILYLDGIANNDLVDEVKRRITNVDVDFINGDGTLAQFIEDEPFMIFPQSLSTERPDRTASFIMAGKVAIIAEGAPFAEIVPVTFFHMFHAAEDTTMKWQYGSFLRLIRFFGFLVAILLPGLYIALNLYRQELIPTELLSAIAESRERVPFPLIFELIAMELSFELIREAGLRVPGVIGNTLGIIGALILGQAAVAANLVSPILIIVVALAGLGNFAMPSYQLALGIRITRFVFIILGAIAGFFGVSLGVFVIGGLICSMKSFGVPFLSPVAPKSRKSRDLIIRHPIWKEELRPDFTNSPTSRKQGYKSKGWLKKSKRGGRQ